MLGIGLQMWFSNFTTIQRWMSPRSETGLVGCGKKKGFCERGAQISVWPNIPLFISRVLTTYYFIKTNSILFVIKCINKMPFYFLSNYYFNTLISLYLFNYKKLVIKFYLFTNNNFFQVSLRKMGYYKQRLFFFLASAHGINKVSPVISEWPWSWLLLQRLSYSSHQH